MQIIQIISVKIAFKKAKSYFIVREAISVHFLVIIFQRLCLPGGYLITMVWGVREDSFMTISCELHCLCPGTAVM